MDGVRSTGSRCAGGRLLIATLLVVLGFSAHAAASHAASRSIRVNFTNNSDSALTLTKAELNHGCWAAPVTNVRPSRAPNKLVRSSLQAR